MMMITHKTITKIRRAKIRLSRQGIEILISQSKNIFIIGFLSASTLHNPDVTELTFPFVRLTQIVIDTDSYDFYLFEKFLTYSVNYIGEHYLKEQVKVQVYGDPEKLHPNVRNNLIHLCKLVEEGTRRS